MRDGDRLGAVCLTSLSKTHCEFRMVAQPDSSPAAAPSAKTMASKRDAPEGDNDKRSLSVKSTRISDAGAEMISPGGGDFAALAATPGLTPATSLAPMEALAPMAVEPAGAAQKRTRAGARSLPPTEGPQEASPP